MRLKQVEPTVEEVGGTKFFITPFPAFKAANLTGELASVLAPLLGALVPLVGDDGGTKEEDRGLLDIDAGKAAEALSNVSGLNGEKIEKLMKKLLLGGHVRAEVENERGNLEPATLDLDLANELFCGDVQDMFALCFHVIKLNFNGFFKRIGVQFGGEGSTVAKMRRPII